jgi:predicted nucleic acid-binding protein
VIILDTNVLSEPLRPAPDPRVIAWLDNQVVDTLYLTTITVAEMRFGIAALDAGRRRRTLAARFEDEVMPLFAGRVLPFDEPATRSYAVLRAAARASGQALGDFDAVVASIALAQAFGVATRDVAPFEVAGVTPLINPFAGD